MKRNIVTIDKEKCNGCGLCVNACHEGALKIIDGVAKLISDSYCDGLGNCLPECPTGAITIEEREASDFDEEAVKKNMESKVVSAHEPAHSGCHGTHEHDTTDYHPGHQGSHKPGLEHFSGCPGSRARIINKTPAAEKQTPANVPAVQRAESQLGQWPCQIKLVPVNAPYFDNAHILVAADCTSFAYANMHEDFMKNKITIIGCPKLDDVDYSQKLTQILANHSIKSITVLRMEVPCCGGIAHAVKNALVASGNMVPWNVITIGTDGSILDT
jgi:ferredoxin